MTVMEHDEQNDDILQKDSNCSLQDDYLDGQTFPKGNNLFKRHLLYSAEVRILSIQINQR
jgi:hypothetical protein